MRYTLLFFTFVLNQSCGTGAPATLPWYDDPNHGTSYIVPVASPVPCDIAVVVCTGSTDYYVIKGQ